jgi:hypothetical protein
VRKSIMLMIALAPALQLGCGSEVAQKGAEVTEGALDNDERGEDTGWVHELEEDDSGISDTGRLPESSYDDMDGDLIADEDEEGVDTDGDGIPDIEDLDSDNDGIPDSVEAGDEWLGSSPIDTDGDGIPDFRDKDSDNDGIADWDEVGPDPSSPRDLDGDGIPDYIDIDSDGDGISDRTEWGDDPTTPLDSDGDGRPDYMDSDSDGDGIPDEWEAGTGTPDDEPRDLDGDGIPDYLDDDSDGDGFLDSEEGDMHPGTGEPRDTDGDGWYDFIDTDSDGDTIRDSDEADYGTDPYDDDTDGDGVSDGLEILGGTSPLDPAESPSEYIIVRTHASAEDYVFSFTLDVSVVDIAFLIDTTGSMGSTATAVASEFSSIVSELSVAISDAEYGVATYDDYAYGSYGYSSSGDKPFILRKQITDDVSAVQSTLSSIPLHFGGDGPESTMEAIYQAARGEGYDQNCSGTYDYSTDIPPFIADPSDVFGGSAEAYDPTVPSGGSIGGMGFRAYALPVIFYATDYDLRDPDAGYGTPGGCPLAAGTSDVVAATADIGARLIAMAALRSTPIGQMESLADATGSYADTDGDGVVDDRLVFSWTGGSSSFRSTVVNAIEDLVNSVEFSSVDLLIEGDDYGLVRNIDPASYASVSVGSGSTMTLDFTITLQALMPAAPDDRIYEIDLYAIGDGSVALAHVHLLVLVPGI